MQKVEKIVIKKRRIMKPDEEGERNGRGKKRKQKNRKNGNERQ